MHLSKLHSYYYGILIILIAIVFTYYQELFLYQRHSIEQGQFWRLFSGHFVHLNNKHLILNLIAWVIIFVLGVNYLSIVRWLVLLLLLTLPISIGLYYFVPEVMFYGGLSGVLHGYFAYILVRWIKLKQKIVWVILLLLITKVLFENFSGSGSSTAEYIGIQVVSEVHLIGVIVGIIFALFIPNTDNKAGITVKP